MKGIISIIVLSCTFLAWAQPRDLTPTKRRQAFGTRDFRNLNMYGLQVQFGPTYTITRGHNKTYETTLAQDGFDGSYTHDPAGRLGFFAEIGMAHFTKKRSKISLWMKTVLISYYDWGLGYEHIGGRETTTMNRFGNETVSGGDFYNGQAYGRFSIHKNVHIGKTFFLDNGLGLNVNYKLVHGNTNYYPAGELPNMRSLYNPLLVQLHYSLGFGFKLKRGSYLIPGIRTPLVGYQMTSAEIGGNGKAIGPKSAYIGNPAFQWFSSKYWPIYPHVKFIYMFEKKAKGCPAVEINDQDKDTQRNR